MEVLRAFQAGGLDRVLETMNTHWAPPEDTGERESRWVKALPSMIEEYGDGEVVRVMRKAPHVLTFVTERTDGPPLAYTFEFESKPPHRILQLSVDTDAGGEGPGLPPLQLADDTAIDTIGNVIEPWVNRLADDGLFSGTVLVGVDGQVMQQSFCKIA